MAKELIDIAGQILFETEKAYRFDSGDKQEWIPKSQCQWDQDNKVMTMPEWIAMEKGFI
jgi:RNase P/RNase MRP subunit p29